MPNSLLEKIRYKNKSIYPHIEMSIYLYIHICIRRTAQIHLNHWIQHRQLKDIYLYTYLIVYPYMQFFIYILMWAPFDKWNPWFTEHIYIYRHKSIYPHIHVSIYQYIQISICVKPMRYLKLLRYLLPLICRTLQNYIYTFIYPYTEISIYPYIHIYNECFHWFPDPPYIQRTKSYYGCYGR